MLDWDINKTLEGIKGFLARNLVILALAGASLGGLAVAEANIPQQYKTFYVTSIIGALIMYAPAKRLVNWLYDPNVIYMVELKAEGDEIALWKFFPQQFQNLKVLENSLDQFTSAEGEIYVCREYDPDNNVAWGTWRGSLSGLELMKAKDKIKEIRGSLEKEAKKGMRVNIQRGSIVRKALNKILGEFAQEYESATIYGGELIEEAMNEVIEEKNLETHEKKESEKEPQETPEGNDVFRALAQAMKEESGNNEPKKEEVVK